jgi:hypothetical protein
MEIFEKSLYEVCYHKRKQQKTFPTLAATFRLHCIWRVILSYTNFILLTTA